MTSEFHLNVMSSLMFCMYYDTHVFANNISSEANLPVSLERTKILEVAK